MDDQFDRILSRDEEILPSSGFAASVMDAIRREASTPPPIPFPWKRALPGLLVAGLVLVAVLVGGAIAITRVAGTPATPGLTLGSSLSFISPLVGSKGAAAGWTALSLLLAYVSVKLSMRLASQ